MRVITGEARGRRLREPQGMDIRPTTDMVKEAVYSIIQLRVPGARFLDLFSGTGQMGIEAISRGAESATFVDRSPEAIRLIRENLKTCGFEDRARVTRTDSLMYLKSGEKYDIVYLDPPYRSELLDKALALAVEFDILRENGIIICESEKDREIADPEKGGYRRREYRYGRLKLTTFTKLSEE